MTVCSIDNEPGTYGDWSHATGALSDTAIRENMTRIKHKIIVMSGKGKSTVAANLAFGLALAGFKIGLLDTDIHGPSLGKMLGIEGQMVRTSKKRLRLAADRGQRDQSDYYGIAITGCRCACDLAGSAENGSDQAVPRRN